MDKDQDFVYIGYTQDNTEVIVKVGDSKSLFDVIGAPDREVDCAALRAGGDNIGAILFPRNLNDDKIYAVVFSTDLEVGYVCIDEDGSANKTFAHVIKMLGNRVEEWLSNESIQYCTLFKTDSSRKLVALVYVKNGRLIYWEKGEE